MSRVNLAGIKAPSMGGTQDQEPWAVESKLHLVNLAIGKKVHCKIEFVRNTQNNFKLSFSSIFVENDAETLSAHMVRAG